MNDDFFTLNLDYFLGFVYFTSNFDKIVEKEFEMLYNKIIIQKNKL